MNRVKTTEIISDFKTLPVDISEIEWVIADQAETEIESLRAERDELRAWAEKSREALDKLLHATALCYSDDKNAEKNIQFAMNVLDQTPGHLRDILEARERVMEAAKRVEAAWDTPLGALTRPLCDLGNAIEELKRVEGGA